jgi:glycosyltransferase involved in cell wall biosynthesis
MNQENSQHYHISKPFSVFIPVYNEEDILVANTERLISHLDGYRVVYEIIIGSNGSNDSTPELGRMLSDRHTQVRFFHLKEKGVGDAFKQGMGMARYDAVVSLDMDLSIHLSFIGEALEFLDAGHDIVIGSKKVGYERRAAFRRLGSDLFILTAGVLLGLPFEDYSIGAKAYKRNLVLEYMNRIDKGTSYVLNIVYCAFRDKRKVIEIPVRCEDYRASRFNIISEGLYRFYQLFRLWYKERINSSAPSHKFCR